MSCKYFFKGVSKKSDKLYQIFSKLAGDEGLSYFELHNLISDNIDLTKYSDTLFSAQTDVYNKLVNLKASPLIFDKWGNVVADDPESGVYNIQHFLDSQYFDPNQKYYTKMNDENYEDALRKRDYTEDQIAKEFERFKLVGADAYVIHYLVNNLEISNVNDPYTWNVQVSLLIGKQITKLTEDITKRKLGNLNTDFQEALLNSFNRVLQSVGNNNNLGSQILQSRIITARENKMGTSTSRVRNIAVTHALTKDGIKLRGHIDQVIVDKYGNIAIYQNIVSSQPYESWIKIKKQKFELELAFLKKILQAKGFNANKISLHLIPTQIVYNDDGSIKDIRMDYPKNIQVQGEYQLGDIDEAVEAYIDTPDLSFGNIDDKVQTALDKTNLMFLNANITQNRITKTIDSYIAQQYNPRTGTGDIVKLEDDPQGYNYAVTIDGEIHKIKEDSLPKNNTELKELLQKEFDKKENQISTVLDTLVKQIQVARHNPQNTTFEAFKRSNYRLVSLLGKYIEPTYIGGDPVYEWNIIDNEALRNAHILLFQNSKGQIDVVSLANYNLYEVNKHRSNGSNIMNSYIMDNQSGNLYNYDCSFGHMEQIRTLNILNEILPQLDGNFKLGNIQVISTYGRGQGMYSTASDLITKYYSPILEVVNKYNNEVKLNNNFGNINFVDQYELITDYISNFLTTSSYLETNPIRYKLKDAKEQLENANSESARRAALQSFLEYLQNNPVIKNLQNGTSDLTYANDNTKMLANIYNQACYEYNKLMGVYVETKYKPLSWLESNIVKPDANSDNNYRTIKQIVTQTTFRANERVMDAANPIQNFTRDYFNQAGYSTVEGSLIGDENKYFDNMFMHNDRGEKIMMFKNPYKNDATNYMNSHEKLFLKKTLFELAKVTYSMHNKKFDFTSYEDPEFAKAVEEQEVLRYVPLKRASPTLSVKSLKNGVNQFFDTIKGLASKEDNVFAKWQQTLDKEGANVSMRDRFETGVTNPFASSMSSDKNVRQEILNQHTNDYWETNIPALLYSYINANILTQEFNKSLILIKSVMFQAKMLALNSGNLKYLEWFQKEADKYLTVNVFNDTILEDTSKKFFTVINPVKHFVSKMFLSFNIKSMFRDTLEGFQQNYIKAATKYGTDISTANLTAAYYIVMKGSCTNVRTISLLNQLCIKYGLSNLDFANIANGLRTDKSGINHWDDIAYNTMKRPDFLNRMTLFVARALQDGVWDALSLDEDGKIKYDWKKDKRFQDILKSPKGSEKYNKAKSLYFSAIRAYNKEHIDSPIGYNEDLPSPYSLETIDKIKQVADSIYGNYDRGGRMMAENMAIGMSFAQFTTYSNGIIANWFGKKRVIKGDKLEQQKNEAGQLLYFTEDGTITTENTGVPVMDNIPIVVQGIFYTFGDILGILSDTNQDDKIKKIEEMCKANPNDAANLRKAFASLLWAAFMSILFKNIFDPGYKEIMKSYNSDDVLASAMTYVVYNGSKQSTQNFHEFLVIPEYFAGSSDASNGMTIPYQSYPTQLVKNMFNTATDPEKHWGEYIVNNVPSLAMYKQATKAYYKEN